MASAVARILIVHRQLSFSLQMKQTLEQLGGFEVAPFTTLETAANRLKERHYHVALVDFALPGVSGLDIVLRLRSIQSDLAIIATPDIPEVVAVVHQMNLNGVIDTPCSARQLLPAIRSAVQNLVDVLPDTAESPALDETDTTRISDHQSVFSAIDSVLIRTGGLDTALGTETISVDMTGADYAEREERHAQTVEFVLRADSDMLTGEKLPEGVTEQSVQLFQKLAEDEPPVPDLEERGTVYDLGLAVRATDSRQLAAAMPPQVVAIPMLPDGTDGEVPTEDVPVNVVLRTTGGDSLSLMELIRTVQAQFPETQGIVPLPSWQGDQERYVEEPDFLAGVATDALPSVDMGDSSVNTTRAADPGQIIGQTGDLPTDKLFARNPVPVERPDSLPEVPQRPPASLPPYQFDAQDPLRNDTLEDTGDTGGDHDALSDGLNAREQSELARDLPAAPPPDALPEMPQDDRITLGMDSADPRIAQLALSLTQVSLELTAQAVLLASGDEIVAYAGEMPLEEIAEIREAVADDWTASEGEARIRFINLPSSGQDFMVYSRQTDGGLTLSLLFAGNLPLRVIKRQGERLLRALQAIPEAVESSSLLDELQHREMQALEEQAAAEVEQAVQSTAEMTRDYGEQVASLALVQTLDVPALEGGPSYEGPMYAYTFVWLLRDPEDELSPRMMQLIARELDSQLADLGWQVENLQVYEDYVYLLADVPGEVPSYDIITDLKFRSAWIARAVNAAVDVDALWADSYCVLAPGREMEVAEIQRFLHFARS